MLGDRSVNMPRSVEPKRWRGIIAGQERAHFSSTAHSKIMNEMYFNLILSRRSPPLSGKALKKLRRSLGDVIFKSPATDRPNLFSFSKGHGRTSSTWC